MLRRMAMKTVLLLDGAPEAMLYQAYDAAHGELMWLALCAACTQTEKRFYAEPGYEDRRDAQELSTKQSETALLQSRLAF
jgi:hypothetical protein